jgi:hypothetical protein
VRHREDGPAVENAYCKEWWINGERHREDGPAIEFAIGKKEWWLNGKFQRREVPVKQQTKSRSRSHRN